MWSRETRGSSKGLYTANRGYTRIKGKAMYRRHVQRKRGKEVHITGDFSCVKVKWLFLKEERKNQVFWWSKIRWGWGNLPPSLWMRTTRKSIVHHWSECVEQGARLLLTCVPDEVCSHDELVAITTRKTITAPEARRSPAAAGADQNFFPSVFSHNTGQFK